MDMGESVAVVPRKRNAFTSNTHAGKSALRYKLGVDILTENLVWIQSPYPANKYTHINIFYKVLRNFLEPGKRVEADKGCCSHADKAKCLGNDVSPAEKRGMQGTVRAHHKTPNERLKNWGIFSQVLRQHILRHGNVFRACAVVTQLVIENGKPLFEVEYED